jgi:hypothetical protein
MEGDDDHDHGHHDNHDSSDHHEHGEKRRHCNGREVGEEGPREKGVAQ